MPLIANNTNHTEWPKVVSQDLTRHIGSFKGEVYTINGQVKGKTLLPLPYQADLVVKASDSEHRYIKAGVKL